MKPLNLVPATLAGAAARIASMGVAGLLLAGCLLGQDGSKSAPSARARFDFQAIAPAALAKAAVGDSSLTISDSSGIAFRVTEARVLVEKVKLVSGDDDSCEGDERMAVLPDSGEDDDVGEGSEDTSGCDETESMLKGPFVVDLLTGTSTPAMGDLSIPAGTYRKVKIHLGHARKEDAILDSTDSLMGRTLLVRGTYAAPGQVEKPFTLALKFDEELEMENLAGMRLDAATLNSILVSVRIDRWLSDMDVGGCLAKPEMAASLAGGAVISEDSELGRCLDVEKTVKEAFRGSFEVEEDEDHDGHGGDSEEDDDHGDDGKDGI